MKRPQLILQPNAFPAADRRRRTMLLGFGSLVTTQLLSGCGGGGGGSGGGSSPASGQTAAQSAAAASTASGSTSAASTASLTGTTTVPATTPVTTPTAASTTTSTTSSSSSTSAPSSPTSTSSSTTSPTSSGSTTSPANSTSSDPATETSGSSTTSSSTAPSSTSGSASQTTSTASKSSKLITGVFSGGYDPSAALAYDKWLGKNTAYNVDFMTNSNYGWDIAQWAPLKAAQPANNMMFSVSIDDMSGTIQGTYDSILQSMASAVASAYPNAIIRIGWEMNGSWYAWSAANRVSAYIQAYNHIAAFFRAKSSGFILEWCPNNGVSSNMDCVQAYPGDTYVDSIGMDTYMDYRYGTQTSAARWGWLVSNTRGLQWQVDFAQQHNKKLGMPEWGVNSDDPLFIENMHSWLVTNNYHHASYWDNNSDFQGQLSKGQYPNAAAAYKSLFGT